MSRDFNKAYEDAVEKARFGEERVVIGYLDDFDPEEVGSSELNFLVRDRKLILMFKWSEVHSQALYNFVTAVNMAMNTAVPLRRKKETVAATKMTYNIPGLYGCTAKTIKVVDGLILPMKPNRNRMHPFLVIEVAFRNETTRELIEEGFAAVSKFTDAHLCLLVQLIETGEPRVVTKVRIILLQRKSDYATVTGLIGAATQQDCRERVGSYEGDIREEARAVDVEVLSDDTITRAQVMRQGFGYSIWISSEAYAEYTGRRRVHEPDLIEVPLEKYLKELFQMIDGLLYAGNYPFSPR